MAAHACGRVQEAQVSLVQLKAKPLAVFQISPPSYSYCPCMLTEAAPAVQPLGAQNSKSWTPIFRHVAKRLGTPRRHRSYIFCGVYFLSGSTTVTFAIYICWLAAARKLPVEVCLHFSFFTQLPTMPGVFLCCRYLLLGLVKVWHVEEVLWMLQLSKLQGTVCSLSLDKLLLGAEIVFWSLWGTQCSGITAAAEKGSGKIQGFAEAKWHCRDCICFCRWNGGLRIKPCMPSMSQKPKPQFFLF